MYYDNLIFTNAQAQHASQVVLDLMKKKRFFLNIPHTNESYPEDREHTLDPKIFSEAIILDQQLKNVYTQTGKVAEASILEVETDLGISPYKLQKDQSVVNCNRYTGGFDICRVYPLSVFASFVPETQDELLAELISYEIGERPEDDFAKNYLDRVKVKAAEVSEKIWADLKRLDVHNPENVKSLVLLKSRFHLEATDADGHFANGTLKEYQGTPFGAGYLFYKFSIVKRIVGRNNVIFNTSSKSHVNMSHWNREDKHSISFARVGGYDCAVMAAIVM